MDAGSARTARGIRPCGCFGRNRLEIGIARFIALSSLWLICVIGNKRANAKKVPEMTQFSMEQAMRTAVRLLQAGRLDEAARALREVLARAQFPGWIAFAGDHFASEE